MPRCPLDFAKRNQVSILLDGRSLRLGSLGQAGGSLLVFPGESVLIQATGNRATLGRWRGWEVRSGRLLMTFRNSGRSRTGRGVVGKLLAMTSAAGSPSVEPSPENT